MIHRNLLKKLKRANIKRKLKLAIENGFDSIDKFKTYLEEHLEPAEEKPIIHIVHILDSSGSMNNHLIPAETKMEGAIKGIEDEIKKLKEDDEVEYFISVHEFSTSHAHLVKFKPIKKVKNISWKRYKYGTKLNDTLDTILRDLMLYNDTSIKVLIKVFTDGQDLHSRIYDISQIARLIKSLPENITFTFVAAKVDENSVKRYEVHETNLMFHDNTTKDVVRAFDINTTATVEYSRSVVKGEDVKTGFYKDLVE